LKSDFLSFQELTPDWNAQLTNRLASHFSYIHTMTRLDQYGMGFFSKFPFQSLDTVYFNEIPNLSGTVQLDANQLCKIVSCQMVPPVNQAAYISINNHLQLISNYLAGVPGTAVVLGDFHLPPWSAEVQKFRAASHLQDGRRDIHPRNIDGSLSLPRIPVEHILFSDQLECTSFSEIGNALVGRIGITGTYQLQLVDEQMVQ
jgi:endonuclease/exonuclease/phosphatase (EEP) superfamily protein YafD